MLDRPNVMLNQQPTKQVTKIPDQQNVILNQQNGEIDLMAAKKLKAGDVITVLDDVEHTMLFDPVVPVGNGAGKKWLYPDGTEVHEDQWLELYYALRETNTKQRNAICKIYHVSYQKLRLKYQPPDPLKEEKGLVVDKRAGLSGLQLVQYLEGEIKIHESAIEQLKEDIQVAKDEAMRELKAQMEALEKI